MPHTNNPDRDDKTTLTTFESRLAQYRGRVYETHFLARKQEEDL